MLCIYPIRHVLGSNFYHFRVCNHYLKLFPKYSTLLGNFKNVVSNRNNPTADNSSINFKNHVQDDPNAFTERYEPYWSTIDLNSFKEKNPNLVIKGKVYIPAFNTADSYVKSNDLSVKIFGFIARNRSFHGDVVEAIQIRRTKDQTVFSNVENLDATEGCRIVRVIERNPQIYKLVGTIKPSESPEGLRVQPKDHRFPAFIIPEESIDTSVLQSINRPLLCTFTFHSWETDSVEPTAKLLNILGDLGNSKAEADALISFYGFNHLEFSQSILNECEELEAMPDTNRVDLTHLNIISIDPPTAKDLDDALSVEVIKGSEDIFRVGVHIADVSHYVKPNTNIDLEARIRGTTVYLDHFVYPMLPRKLSEDLCSLLPNTDKKCFSMTCLINVTTGSVTDIKFFKSVISSRYKLSYDLAEEVLIGKYVPVLSEALKRDIRLLYKISQVLKVRRGGNSKSVNISSDYSEQFFIPLVDNNDQPITPEDIKMGNYPKFKIEALHPKSHSLVEELMVLTNHLVAKHLLNHYKLSMFRIHQDTSAEIRNHLLNHLPVETINKLNINLDSVPIPKLLTICKDKMNSFEYDSLSFVALQKFKEACYIASETSSKTDLSHWGLGIESYLHFTSPIRRYADLITHRLLEDSISPSKLYNYDCETVSSIASVCNTRKRLAFDVQIEYRSFIFNKYLQWANEISDIKVIEGFVKDPDTSTIGYKTVSVILEIILPSPVYTELEKGNKVNSGSKQADKTAICFYIPFLRQTRSLSTDRLNIEPVKATFTLGDQLYTYTFANNHLESDLKSSDTEVKTSSSNQLKVVSLTCSSTSSATQLEIKTMSTMDISLIPGSQTWSLALFDVTTYN